MTNAMTQTVARKSFDSPYDLEAPPGAEGWKELYPYNLVFQENLRDKENAKFWFCDSQHWPNVFKPFETVGVEFAVRCLGAFNTRHYIIPPANGIEFRIHNGFCYMSPVAVAPELIGDRVPHFMERAGYYFANWDSLLENWKKKVLGTIEEMDAINFEALPEMVDLEVITSGAGIDPSAKMMADYDRLIQLAYQNWEYHFEFLNLGYVAYLDFFGFCKESFPGIPDLAIARMVQGVDSVLFRPDDELKGLAELGVKLNLAEIFAVHEGAEQTLAAIAASDGGAEWLAAWEKAQEPWFNYTSGNGFYGSDVYWRDNSIYRSVTSRTMSRALPAATSCAARPTTSSPNATASSANTRTSCPVTRWPPSRASWGSLARSTPTLRTTTSTSSTGRWACSGAKYASSRRCSTATVSGRTPTTCCTSRATRYAR